MGFGVRVPKHGRPNPHDTASSALALLLSAPATATVPTHAFLRVSLLSIFQNLLCRLLLIMRRAFLQLPARGGPLAAAVVGAAACGGRG